MGFPHDLSGGVLRVVAGMVLYSLLPEAFLLFRWGWRGSCPATCVSALGEGLGVHLELLRLLLDVDGSGEPGLGVPLLVI